MKKLSVFLSSAMTGELLQERTGLRVFFKSEPTLLSFAELYSIEDHASPTSIEKAFVNEVQDSHVLILVLNKELRPAVQKEFQTARDHGVRPLIFIRERTDDRDPALAAFIANEAYRFHCVGFSGVDDLCGKVRTTLIDDVLNTYRRAEPVGGIPASFVQLSRSPSDGAPLFTAEELDSLRANPEIAKLDSSQLVTIAMLQSSEKWDYKTALILLELAIAQNPSNWQAFHNKGQVLSDIGLERESHLFLNRALELNPNSDPTLHNLGVHYYRAGNTEAAKTYFERALSLVPDKFSSLSYLVNIAIEQKHHSEAEAFARRAFNIEPGDLERGNLAYALALNGKLAEARALLSIATVRSKEFLRASAYTEELDDNIPGAIALLDEFDQRFGLERRLCMKKAFFLLHLERYSEAREWFSFAEKHVAFQASDYNNFGWKWQQLKQDPAFAAALFEKALALDPTVVATWKNLQCCYASDATLDRAIEVSRRGMKYHPDDPGIFGNLAQALLRSGQLSQYGDLLVERAISVFGGTLTEEKRQEIRREIMASPALTNLTELEKLVRSLPTN